MARRARICHLTSVHPTFDHRIFYKECGSLARAGFEVTLVCPDDRREVARGVRIVGIGQRRGGRLRRMTETVGRVFREAIAQDADLYHFHDPELLPVGFALRARGRKVIYDEHEDVPRDIMIKDYLPLGVRRVASRVADRVEMVAARVFDGIVVPLDYMADRFVPVCRHVCVLHNFAMLEEFLALPRPPRRSGPLRLVYAGNNSAVRGVEAIVQAIGQLPSSVDVELHLFGEQDPESFIQDVQKVPGGDRVRYHGIVDHSQIPRLLSEMDVGMACLQPTETYLRAPPTKLYEYMALGLPAITSNFDVYRRIVETHDCGLCVDPTSPAAIAAAIATIAEKRDLGDAMGERGRAASRQYSWETEGARLVKMYEQILEER